MPVSHRRVSSVLYGCEFLTGNGTGLISGPQSASDDTRGDVNDQLLNWKAL